MSSTADFLRLRLAAPREVQPGAAVLFTLRVENVARRPLELYLRGRTIAFDVVVARAGGSVIWHRLEGEVVPAIARLEVLAPGRPLELGARWDQRTHDGALVPPGEYLAHGALFTDEPEPLATPPVPLRIVAR